MDKEDIKNYKIFICEECRIRWSRSWEYRDVPKYDLIGDEDEPVRCRFCRETSIRPFKSIQECIRYYKEVLKYTKQRYDRKVPKTESNLKQREKFKEDKSKIKILLRHLYARLKDSKIRMGEM